MSTTTHEFLTPAEMADACGVSIDTLRYYEREGLLEPVARTESGRRRYSADDAAWVRVLRCLRVSAMPIRDMKEFAELVRRGDEAIPDRLDILRRVHVEVDLAGGRCVPVSCHARSPLLW